MGMPVTSVTVESVTYTRNAATTLVGDQNSVQSGNRNTYGVIIAAALLSTGLVAAVLLAVSRLCAPLGLLVTVKESLMLSERKASLL